MITAPRSSAVPTSPPEVAGIQRLREAGMQLRKVELNRRLGVVRSLRGLAIEADGPRTHVGELCAIVSSGAHGRIDLQSMLFGGTPAALATDRVLPERPQPILAEVVAVHDGRVTLMPYGSMQGLAVGATVIGLGDRSRIGVGESLLGRVIDGFGRPMDGFPAPETHASVPVRASPVNPMHRPRIEKRLDTGIRSIDGLLTLGQGQRVGIFAGSGVGKSTLLGMIARHVQADVNVIALIGERGREVREFVEKQLGTEGLRRSVVVVAPADQPALARIRAAYTALAIAEHFRTQGQQVLLTMDSITRLAMARREVGLSAGEPPTARGYTPSVFAELPELCERCGTAPGGGAITALLTVLVEGDDLNEPVSDALRAILDGHIVLSRHIAHQGQYPAIDVLKSASRLMPDLTSPEEREAIHDSVRTLALLERNRQMVELGAYESGSNPELDAALVARPLLQKWLQQTEGGVPRSETMQALQQWRAIWQSAGQAAGQLMAAEPARSAASPAGNPKGRLS